MDTLARQGIEIGGQGGHQRFTFTGLHFGNLAVIQDHATDELHIEMPHAEGTPGSLSHRREGFGHNAVEAVTALQAIPELLSHATQCGVGQGLKLGLQGIYLLDEFAFLVDDSIVAATNDHLDQIA